MRRWVVLAIWTLLAVGSAILYPALQNSLVGANFSVPGTESSRADQLVEGRMQAWHVSRRDEGRVRVHAEPDHRLAPARRIVGIAAEVAPEDGANLLGECGRESAVEADEAALDEMGDLRVVERARTEFRMSH